MFEREGFAFGGMDIFAGLVHMTLHGGVGVRIVFKYILLGE